jgi:SAM-dependent methyltransferase
VPERFALCFPETSSSAFELLGSTRYGVPWSGQPGRVPSTANGELRTPVTDPVRGYDEGAETLAARYEHVRAEDVHAACLDMLPAGADRLALDIGAGSGRDAAWLCRLGFEVVSVEPARRMREAAQALHASQAIRWLDDRLPALSATHRLGLAFDVILLSGVLMHVPADERPRAFRKMATLLKPGGLLLMSVRDGAGTPDRPMWPVAAGEIESFARSHGLAIVKVVARPDLQGRPDVHWLCCALRLPDDGTGALPLLRGIILNDDKSATYKLGLLRALRGSQIPHRPWRSSGRTRTSSICLSGRWH